MNDSDKKIEELLRKLAAPTPQDFQWQQRFHRILLAYIAKNPIAAPSFFGAFASYVMKRRDNVAPREIRTGLKPMPVLISLFIALFAATGTSLAAEQALPGDVLFLIKTGVNERVAAALRVSAEDQAQFRVSLVEKRAREIARLAARGELSAQNEVEISARLHAHIRAARLSIDAAAHEDVQAAAEASAALDATLHVWGMFLERFENGEGGTKGLAIALEKIRVNIHAESETNGSATVAIEREEREQASLMGLEMGARGKVGAAAHKINAIERLVIRAEERELSQANEARAKFTAASRVLAEAHTSLVAENWTEAFLKAQEAIRLSTEAQVLTNAGIHIEIRHETESGKNSVRDDADEQKNHTTIRAQESLEGNVSENSPSLNIGLRLRSLFR